MTAKPLASPPPAIRRRFLAALTGMTGALVAPAATAAQDRASIAAIRNAANALADAMATRHGDQWECVVDHVTGFVLIQPVPRSKRRG